MHHTSIILKDQNKRQKAGILIFLLLLVSGCGERSENKVVVSEQKEIAKTQRLFKTLSSNETGIDFVNYLPETTYNNGLFYEYYYNGSGVAAGDFNNDGLPDVYFVSTLKENRLYLNQGGLRFMALPKTSGVSGGARFQTGVTTVDINGDGRLDIYVCASGQFKDPDKRRNELYINQGLDNKGHPYFKEAAKEYGLDLPHFSTQAAFFDYDRDGDLDMFLINHDIAIYSEDKIAAYSKISAPLSGEALFRNEGGKFVEVTKTAGIVSNRLSFGLGVAIGDLNNDAWPDIYVSHDFSGEDHLYINKGNGSFREVIKTSTGHISNFSMGNEIVDFNNDGNLDIITLDMVSEDNYGIKTSMSGMSTKRFNKHVGLGLHHQYMYNGLQMNSGSLIDKTPVFSDIAQMAGISNTDWSWGPLCFDMDLDGLKDLFISNGIKRDFRNNDFVVFHKNLRDSLEKQKALDLKSYVATAMQRMPTRNKPNYFFKNTGNLTFKKMNGQWGSDQATSSNGAAYADFDGDGDLDIVVNNTDRPSYVQQNLASDLHLGNYLKVGLKGSKKNRNGIGAKVSLTTSGTQQVQEHYVTRGFQSSVATGLCFGLGAAITVESLEVVWPDGKKQELGNLKANQELLLDYRDATWYEKRKLSKKPWVRDIAQTVDLSYRHIENVFDDFERESLLPHKMSQFGPALAVGDIDKDGLDDFFIGGALGQVSVLYRQNKIGGFDKVSSALFDGDKQFEDVNATFFDAEGDGDMDLYVVSGGNEREVGSQWYRDRLYINNGGAFKSVKGVLPDFRTSGSCAKAFDFDGDGDLDLFVGGRQVPGKYPMPAQSHLLKNMTKETGKLTFVDITETQAGVLKNLGMVTDAVWADIDRDGLSDLIVVGEWMAPVILINSGQHFEKIMHVSGLTDETGWWNSIIAHDFDQDGDMDLLAGNLGLNYKYKASKEEPFEIYTTDFDESGDLDIVLGYHSDGQAFPLRGRECSSREMPFIKKKFATYDAFGKATLAEVYGKEKLNRSTHYSAGNFANCFFENKGSANFEVRKLPMQVQTSSINTILVADVNRDGKEDVIMAGNLYGSEVETPRNDASYGWVLKGQDNFLFTPISMTESGLYLPSETRHLEMMNYQNGKAILAAVNNGKMKIFKLK